MKTSIVKMSLTVVLLTCFVLTGNVSAETEIKVAILPFSLDAQTQNEQVKTRIPQMISEKLKEEGTVIVFPDQKPEISQWKFEQFQKQGIELGVDYILTGSIFMAGTGISIDTRLINVYEKENETSFYTDARDLENLFSAITSLSKELVAELYHKKIITDIAVIGNNRVEADAILKTIDTKPGDVLKPGNMSSDLKKIYAMGYFDNVVVKKETLDSGIKITFEIAEKSSVRRVDFKKNTVYEENELLDSISTRTGSILNIHRLKSDVERLRLLYTEKNYHNCVINYEINPLKNSQADIIFTIEEGHKIRVEKITFEGNKYFTDKKIKKAIQTSEKGFFSFFTSSGDLNETEVQNDVVRIESLYKNNGFIDTKVSDPIINIGEKMISVHFKIDEGGQYRVKDVQVKGDMIVPEEELLEPILSKPSELYNRDNIRKDILSISDTYAGKGFASVVVTPLISRDDEAKTMSITYSIAKGDPVHFNRVDISGNTKTRDKVIRREIKIVEQDLYSKENIEKSLKNLNRLNYFENISVKPLKTEDDALMDLDVNVTERETGAFSVGGGLSSTEGGFVKGSVQERNLFGRGQTIKLEGKLSKETILYELSFFEPYIMDSLISGGIKLYREEREFDHYDKDATGLSLTLGYRLFDYTRIGLVYNIEDYEITDVETAFTNTTPGSFFTSSIKPYIAYDSRDDLFLPTEGMVHKASIEYAGSFLGGDIDYTRYLAETGIFFPLFWKFTGSLHAEGGYLDDRTGNNIDIDFTRFYLGGMKSVRGFDRYDIDGTREGDAKERGGEKYVQFNAEITFPITEKYKLAGVLFYDRGDVYRTSESIDLGDQFSSFGTGFRWDSPVGPLRIEYGWVIDGKNVKKSGDGQFEFSVGASF